MVLTAFRLTNMVDAVGTNKYTYNIAGRLLTEDGPWSNDTVTNIYSNGLRTGLGLQQPTGVWTNAFGYDAARRLTSVTSPAGTFTYQYPVGTRSTASQIQKLSLPNGSYITNTYDGNARMLGTWLKNSGNTTLDSATYVYNAGNQRTWFTNAANTKVSYSYDPIGQLKVGDSSLNFEDRGYTYDAAWNLNYRTNNGTLQTFKVDGLNELTNAVGLNYTYDSNGNLTGYAGITCTYDDENRLTLVSDDVNHTYRTGYVYDGLGRLRVRQQYSWQNMGGGSAWVTTFQWRTVYDGMRVIQDRYTDNLIAAYTWGTDLSGSLEGAGGIGGLLARTDQSAQTHAYYHADGNGNITYLVDSSQALAAKYRYDAFGNTLSSSGSLASANVYRFSSKEVDPNTGLYNYGFRWYAPNLQRWPNRDPAEELGGINLYGFVLNNPVSYIDSYGLWTATIKCKGGKYVVDLGGAKGQPYEKCVTAHEQQHIDDWKKRYGENSCQGVPDGQLPMGGTDYKDFLHDSECKAHAVARDCAKKLADGCKDAGDKATDKNYADSENKYLKDNKCPQYQK